MEDSSQLNYGDDCTYLATIYTAYAHNEMKTVGRCLAFFEITGDVWCTIISFVLCVEAIRDIVSLRM